MRSGKRPASPVRISRTTWMVAGTLVIGIAMAAATPAIATDCVSRHGLIEAVRPCAQAEAAGAFAAIQLPRSVSVQMPAAPVRLGSALHAARVGDSATHAAIISDVARRYRIDPRLLSAMVQAESAGRPRAVSSKGALGLMQVMPATARSMGVADPQALLANPALAIETGAAYLKTLQAQLGNDVPLVVAAYNAGPGAILKAGRRIPAYRETQAYVGKVMAQYAAGRAEALR